MCQSLIIHREKKAGSLQLCSWFQLKIIFYSYLFSSTILFWVCCKMHLKNYYGKIFSHYRLLYFSKLIEYLISSRFMVSLPSREFTPIGFIRSHLLHCGVLYPPWQRLQTSFCHGESSASSMAADLSLWSTAAQQSVCEGYFWVETVPEDIHSVTSGLSASPPFGSNWLNASEKHVGQPEIHSPMASDDPHFPSLYFMLSELPAITRCTIGKLQCSCTGKSIHENYYWCNYSKWQNNRQGLCEGNVNKLNAYMLPY